MIQVKIYGAGSIGNHLTQACRRANWNVVVVDTDPEALRRMREEIYPKRYGGWDKGIQLFTYDTAPKGGFDVIFIGTPPDARIAVAKQAIAEQPRLIQFEKPIAPPNKEGEMLEIMAAMKDKNILGVVGYEYPLGEGAIGINTALDNYGGIGEVQVLEVSFRETWKGILVAHPWLKGPEETYLGYWRRGGGTCGEHSHAIHFWQHFARRLGLGEITHVSAAMDEVVEGRAIYDRSSFLNVRTETGFLGRIAQDVVTDPPLHTLRMQGKRGFIEWRRFSTPQKGIFEEVDFVTDSHNDHWKFPIKRPDDFYHEIDHIRDILDGKIAIKDSPLNLDTGFDTLNVISAAHRSHSQNGAFVPTLHACGAPIKEL